MSWPTFSAPLYYSKSVFRELKIYNDQLFQKTCLFLLLFSQMLKRVAVLTNVCFISSVKEKPVQSTESSPKLESPDYVVWVFISLNTSCCSVNHFKACPQKKCPCLFTGSTHPSCLLTRDRSTRTTSTQSTMSIASCTPMWRASPAASPSSMLSAGSWHPAPRNTRSSIHLTRQISVDSDVTKDKTFRVSASLRVQISTLLVSNGSWA